ncbi:class A beta-lactamase-related serine hydrolase, partial [Fulvivirga sp. RKSG066]|uniref:serine hydrolase domain-containing protein n=1 Tax=Fulvivirga aurantia TaxID=2529383 RepID=UPI0012BCB821
NKASDFKADITAKLRKYPKQIHSRIDSILSFYNRKDQFNGNALVAYKGEVLFEKSYNNQQTNNQPQSHFRIGSSTKTFTSTLTMLLVNEGKIQLSDSIGAYIPYFTHGEVTIEQLLTHQSGIPNYLVNNNYISQISHTQYSLSQLVKNFCSDSLEFIPGSRFKYSNSGYIILALLAEKVTNQSFQNLLQERIFTPLDMTDTYLGRGINTKVSAGFLYGKPEPKYFIDNVSGAGGIISTSRDLLIWSQNFENNILLSKNQQEEMFKPRASYDDWSSYYGYGWMIDKEMFDVSKKHQIFYHPGTDYGFYTMFLKQPDKGITIILLNNTGDFPRFDISDLILSELN